MTRSHEKKGKIEIEASKPIDDGKVDIWKKRFKQSAGHVSSQDLYVVLNRTLAEHGFEGQFLLRILRPSTGLFAYFVGFLACFLQSLVWPAVCQVGLSKLLLIRAKSATVLLVRIGHGWWTTLSQY